jgi:hypothetical protein
MCVCVCMFKINSLTNQILCSDYSEPGDKHITRILSLYLESRATSGISASIIYIYAIPISRIRATYSAHPIH